MRIFLVSKFQIVRDANILYHKCMVLAKVLEAEIYKSVYIWRAYAAKGFKVGL